jgi:hypothetical protein
LANRELLDDPIGWRDRETVIVKCSSETEVFMIR